MARERLPQDYLQLDFGLIEGKRKRRHMSLEELGRKINSFTTQISDGVRIDDLYKWDAKDPVRRRIEVPEEWKLLLDSLTIQERTVFQSALGYLNRELIRRRGGSVGFYNDSKFTTSTLEDVGKLTIEELEEMEGIREGRAVLLFEAFKREDFTSTPPQQTF